jgi:hypothetical protein
MICWDILNASYHTNVCLQEPAHVIAIAALVLAYKRSNSTFPLSLLDKEWLYQKYCTLDQIFSKEMI